MMAQQTKPVNFLLQDPKPGQTQIFHVLNTTTGARTPLPAGVTTMKTIVTKDINIAGMANHGPDAVGITSENVGIVGAVGTANTATVVGGQSFTMPVVRKLSPGQKIIPIAKHKLFLPTSASNKNVNGKVVISPKLYKVISTTSSHSVSRNLTFSPPANNSTITAVSANNVTFAKTLGIATTNAIPSTSVMTKPPSLTLPISATSNSGRYNTSSKTPSVMNNSSNTINEIVSMGNKGINNGTITKSYNESGNDCSTFPQVSCTSTLPVVVKTLQSNHNNKEHSQQQLHSYSKKTPSSQIHTPASRRQKTDKAGRGLRHFSMKVCEKVKAKGTTTYNEVANELVAEETQNHHPGVDPASYDQKNIRRRVYDALNVLMAMKIISKEKKEIRWHGLPTSNTLHECEELEKENEKARRRIELKQQQLLDLVQQHVALKSLIARNKSNEERGLVPNPSSAVQLPFIIVNTDRKNNINCNISNDKSEYSFKFEDSFEIHDDVQILKRIGLSLGLEKGQYSEADLKKIKSMVPKSVEKYIDAYGLGFEHDDMDDWEMSSLYNGPDNDDSLSTQDMLGFNDTTNDMLDDDMKFEDDEDD
ncbi:transcription factor Dp [Anopheles funestus]|uniref:E2F/DP family winged-helix DNA-binding domain-containing protein n=1 Tax=Anopheles funestus TaxID=62324 RepID=A0A182RWY3_ANOFN|nr:transcription factor Dp [Anopheles funestus]